MLESRSDDVSPASCWLVTVKGVHFYGVRGNELDETRFYVHAFCQEAMQETLLIKVKKVIIKDHLSR